MKGIKFNNFHSWTEWGLILSEKEIKSPKAKTKEVDIAGGDGVLDYTEYFGGVKFENRQLTFKFAKTNIVLDEFLALFSTVQNALHGEKMKIVLDDDPDHYYIGRVTISEWKANKRVGEITVEVDAEPYKYKVAETVVTQAVTGTTPMILTNSKMPVVPTITTTAAMTIAFGGYSVEAKAGTFRIPEMQLAEGQNAVTVTGEGSITFRYRQGSL